MGALRQSALTPHGKAVRLFASLCSHYCSARRRKALPIWRGTDGPAASLERTGSALFPGLLHPHTIVSMLINDLAEIVCCSAMTNTSSLLGFRLVLLRTAIEANSASSVGRDRPGPGGRECLSWA